jgi:hypothetical protein
MSILLKLLLPFHLWTWTGTLPENDNRQLILVQHEVESAKEHNIIVWSHGMNGFDKDEFEERTAPAIKWLVEQNKSFTWIHPELSWSTRLIKPYNQRTWVKPDSFKNFVDKALSLTPPLKTKKEIKLIIVGHSRGGKSIAEAAKIGGLCKLNPTWVVWSDASYGDWLDKAWNSCLNKQPIRVEIWYLKGAATQVSVKRIERGNKNLLLEIHPLTAPWYHGRVGNKVIQMTEALR